MSVARQPNPRRAPGAALLAGLALLVAALVVTAALISSRPPAPVAPVPGPTHPVSSINGTSRATAAHPPAAAGRSGARPKVAVSPKRKRVRQLPVVQIVERRVPLSSAGPPEGAPAEPPAATVLSPETAAVDQRARKPQPSRALPDVVEAPPPAPEAPPPAPAETDEPDRPPEPIVRAQARYPEEATREDVTGSVRLKVIVDRRGRVEDALVVRSSGDDRLDAAAEEAVRRSRYRPARRRGRAVTGVDYVVIDFYRDDRERSGD